MKESDYPDFLQLLSATCQYYKVDYPPMVLQMYWNALRIYELDEIKSALNVHMQNPDVGQFMPKVADIVRAINGSTKDVALVAWSKVERAIRHVGPYHDIVFDDPIIHRVLEDMGGWIKICETSESSLPFVSNEFQTRYRGYMQTGGCEKYRPLLIGIINAQNRRNGYNEYIAPPVMIGDASKCLQVMKQGEDMESISITAMSKQLLARIESQQEAQQ